MQIVSASRARFWHLRTPKPMKRAQGVVPEENISIISQGPQIHEVDRKNLTTFRQKHNTPQYTYIGPRSNGEEKSGRGVVKAG